MSSSANNIVLQPVNVLWRIESSAQLDWGTLTGLDVKGKYLTLSSPSTDYYLWGDDAVAADPAPAGLTAIPYTVTGDGDSAATLAAAAQTAIDAEGDFSATVSGTKVTYEAAAVGQVTDPADVDSGVAVTICRKGKDYDLGLLQGDVEPNFEPSVFDITAHQTGVTVLSNLYQGISTNEAEIVLQETTRSQLETLYSIWGGSFTPAAGTAVFGAGTGPVGTNMLIEAARLEMIPATDLGTELSYQYTMMLAIPVPSSLVFSGENPRVLNTTWRGFPDLTKDSRVDSILIGDPTQTGI